MGCSSGGGEGMGDGEKDLGRLTGGVLTVILGGEVGGSILATPSDSSFDSWHCCLFKIRPLETKNSLIKSTHFLNG